jgi:hypothetical protein
MSGLRLAMVVGALIIGACALFTWLALPDRADDDPALDPSLAHELLSDPRNDAQLVFVDG